MTFSAAILNIILIVGAGISGVEYGRRHPSDAWSELFKRIRSGLDKIGDKLDADDDITMPPPGAMA
jgi:hypothetical protein